MRLERIDIQNFRLLRRVSIALAKDQAATVFVGPNNSGKTSVMDALMLFFGPKDGPRQEITIYDIFQAGKSSFFSIQQYMKKTADERACAEHIERSAPRVQVDLIFSYDESKPNLMVAAELLMNLNPDDKRVGIRAELAIKNPPKLVTEFKNRRSSTQTLFEFLSEKFSDHYSLSFFKISADKKESEPLENGDVIRRLLKIDMISAQRFIDDGESSRATKLSRLLHDHYNRYYKSKNLEDYDSIEEAIKSSLDNLTEKYEKTFKRLKTRLENFGYPPGHTSPQMKIKAEMSAETIYRDNTRVYYENEHTPAADKRNKATGKRDKFQLPERYNGLGYKNLIYIVLQIESFCAFLDALPTDRPCVHIIAIEEPEAHLHPQMQCVFIREISKALVPAKGVQSQVIVSTHSSHIIGDSGFEPIRYFRRHQSEVFVKDLSHLKPPDEHILRFLKRYVKLMHCDLFFADKAILVEGQVERLLLPMMLEKYTDLGTGPNLANQYISILEVGGAHVHKFQALIDFIEIPTLIITDIDSVNHNKKKCPVARGETTSNAALIKWIPAKTKLIDLMNASEDSKTKKSIRIAYQTTENGHCGRSFEEAFFYANFKWLEENHVKLESTGVHIKKGIDWNFKKGTELNLSEAVYTICTTLSKVNFALDLVTETDWAIPKYIVNGLKWLAVQEPD